MSSALTQQAKEILYDNWHKNFTVPSWDLYPYQWSWDSAFNAIGWSHIDTEKAWQDLESLFREQWENGMVPHIVFHEDGGNHKGYFPGVDFWDSKHQSSVFIQPPLHATACLQIYEKADDRTKAREGLKGFYPKLLAWHTYLMKYRDPEHAGLYSIVHPWESGMDNSPRWDKPLSGIEIDRNLLPEYTRLDIPESIDPAHRPTDREYETFIYLIELYRKSNFDINTFYNESPFLIKDLVGNSIFYIANKDLLQIADILGEDSSEIREWMHLTEKNFYRHFFNTKECLFYDFDVRTGEKTYTKTGASLVPIYTGLLTKTQARNISKWIGHDDFCGHEECDIRLVPSAPIDHEGFDLVSYWRGPIWINVNWLIYRGLLRYNLFGEARELEQTIIDVVSENGFCEYYSVSDGACLGAKNFSWSAALVLDLLQNGSYKQPARAAVEKAVSTIRPPSRRQSVMAPLRRSRKQMPWCQ